MAWALVNTDPVPLTYSEWQGEGLNAKIVVNNITAVPGTICNLVSYDGVSPYTPAENYRLKQVPDNAKVGDAGF